LIRKRFKVCQKLSPEQIADDATRQREESARQLRELEEKRWQASTVETCQQNFAARSTSISRSVISRAEINDALGWQLGVKGLWIVGDTGH